MDQVGLDNDNREEVSYNSQVDNEIVEWKQKLMLIHQLLKKRKVNA